MEEKTRLRVALTITELNVGGAERCLTNLALGLDRRRFEPLVVSLGPRPTGEQAILIKRLESQGVPVFFLDLTSAREFPSALKKLERLYRNQAPDVVQTFLFHANVVGAWAARRAAVPAVAMGVRVADPRRWRLWTERFAASDVQRIVCVSQAVADSVVRRGGFPVEKIEVIPNGIDLALYDNVTPIDPATLGVPPSKRMLVAVGRLDKQKGLDWLMSLAPDLFRRLPDHHWVLVGDGPLRKQLAERAVQLKVTDRVHLAGWRSDIPGILAASDALLLPSRWEGMPNVVLEAMASRLPVIATRSEGVCELLGVGADLQTTPYGNSQAFMDKVLAIIGEQSLARELGQANRERAEQSFALATMTERFARLFSTLGSGKS